MHLGKITLAAWFLLRTRRTRIRVDCRDQCRRRTDRRDRIPGPGVPGGRARGRTDGKGFVATGAKGNGDNNWWVATLGHIDAASGALRVIAAPKMQAGLPRVSPDGRTVIYDGEGHAIRKPDQLDQRKRTVEWFGRYLK
ncbi:MAG: family peptidase [Massilia sp.]|nr:family peptidase [Massilia sp.]